MDEDKSIQRCGTLWLDGIWECWSIFSLIAYAVKHIFFDTRLIVYASPWAAIIIFDKLNANGTGHFRRVWVWVNTDLPLPTPPPTPETHHKGILSQPPLNLSKIENTTKTRSPPPHPPPQQSPPPPTYTHAIRNQERIAIYFLEITAINYSQLYKRTMSVI